MKQKTLSLISSSSFSVFIIVLCGFFLRIYCLNCSSLWYDETFSIVTSSLPLNKMIDELAIDFVHPPLHYLLLNIWLRCFGIGAFQARFLSVIFGTLSIIIIYLLARYLFDHRTALFSCLLLTISQLGVMYSQEVRPYNQLLFLSVCSIYLFIVAFQKKQAFNWWGFIILSVLMIYTHYYSIFVLFSLLLYTIFYNKRYALPYSWLIGGMIVILLLFIPWLASGVIEQALNSPKTLAVEMPKWFAISWKTPLSNINFFNNSRLNGIFHPFPKWTFLFSGLLFTIPAFLPLIRTRKSSYNKAQRLEQDNLIFLYILWLMPLLLVFVLSGLLGIQYNIRYILFCIIPYYILVAHGIAGLTSDLLRWIIIALIVAYSLYALRSNYFIPYKENYRDALAYLAKEYQKDDCVYFSPFEGIPAQWFIYHKNPPTLRVETLENLSSDPSKCHRVWLVAYRRAMSAIKQNEKAIQIIKKNYSKTREKKYFWVNVSLFRNSKEPVQ